MPKELYEFYADQKVLQHPERIAEWREKGYTSPITVDFDLTNRCNHDCPGCISGISRKEKVIKTINGRESSSFAEVPYNRAKELIQEFGDMGVAGINLGGGGEPTCHPNAGEIMKLINENGMTLGLFTNAQKLSDNLVDSIAKYCDWTRVSLDAGSPELFKETHGVKPDSFYEVLDNIKRISDRRNELETEMVLGTSYLLGSHTLNGIYDSVRISKEQKADYTRLRPFERYGDFSNKEADKMMSELERARESFEDNNFKVSYDEVRCNHRAGEDVEIFKICYVPHFWASIDANLQLHPCCYFKNSNMYSPNLKSPDLGNLTDRSFKEVWESHQRTRVSEDLDISGCPHPCQFYDTGTALYQISLGNLGTEEINTASKKEIMHANHL